MKNNLKQLRSEKNLTQEKLCKELRGFGLYMTRSTYAKYELGKRNISCENLCIFADFFETTIDKILRQS